MSRALLEHAIEVLEQDGWPLERRPGEPRALMRAGGDSGDWPMLVEARHETLLVVRGWVPEPVAEPRRAAVSELLMRVNFGLAVGNFELGIDTGEAVFRTSADFEGVDDVPSELIRHLVLLNVVTMDRFLPAIRAVAHGDAPQRALLAGEAADRLRDGA